MLEGEERVGGPGWAGTADHVDVGGADGGGVEEAHDAGYHAAPVAALGCWWGLACCMVMKGNREMGGKRGNTVLVVAELEHQFMACFCVLGKTETFLTGARREPIVWQGRGNNVKGWSVGATLC